MGGFIDGLAQAVFDPMNVTGAFGNQRSPGRPHSDFADPGNNPRNANGRTFEGPGVNGWGNEPSAPMGKPPGFQGDAFSADDPSFWDNSKGFISGMTDHSNNPAATAAFGEGKANPKPFESQWQFAAGKGPQWMEPKLENKQWSATVNNGPAKGNRF